MSDYEIIDSDKLLILDSYNETKILATKNDPAILMYLNDIYPSVLSKIIYEYTANTFKLTLSRNYYEYEIECAWYFTLRFREGKVTFMSLFGLDRNRSCFCKHASEFYVVANLINHYTNTPNFLPLETQTCYDWMTKDKLIYTLDTCDLHSEIVSVKYYICDTKKITDAINIIRLIMNKCKLVVPK